MDGIRDSKTVQYMGLALKGGALVVGGCHNPPEAFPIDTKPRYGMELRTSLGKFKPKCGFVGRGGDDGRVQLTLDPTGRKYEEPCKHLAEDPGDTFNGGAFELWFDGKRREVSFEQRISGYEEPIGERVHSVLKVADLRGGTRPVKSGYVQILVRGKQATVHFRAEDKAGYSEATLAYEQSDEGKFKLSHGPLMRASGSYDMWGLLARRFKSNSESDAADQDEVKDAMVKSLGDDLETVVAHADRLH